MGMNEAARKAFEEKRKRLMVDYEWSEDDQEYDYLEDGDYEIAQMLTYDVRVFEVAYNLGYEAQQKRIDELKQALSDAIEIAEDYDVYGDLYCNLKFESLKNMLDSENE